MDRDRPIRVPGFQNLAAVFFRLCRCPTMALLVLVNRSDRERQDAILLDDVGDQGLSKFLQARPGVSGQEGQPVQGVADDMRAWSEPPF
jgi:hypothetical protein